MNEQKRKALETIILESERLRSLAVDSDEDLALLGYLLETALNEARSQLLGAGYSLPVGSNLIPFKRR